MSPLMAQSGHRCGALECPLSGVKRTSGGRASMSAFDPKRTSAARICCDAQCSPQHGRVRSSAGGQPVRRRDFISLLGTTAAAWPFAARAQQPTMSVIGFLGSDSPELYTDRLRAFRRGLKVAGYIESENVVIEYRWANGDN